MHVVIKSHYYKMDAYIAQKKGLVDLGGTISPGLGMVKIKRPFREIIRIHR